MVVGDEDPADPLPHRRADDGLDVAGVVGAGVDHRHLVDADEVGVGARPGHQGRGWERRSGAREGRGRWPRRASCPGMGTPGRGRAGEGAGGVERRRGPSGRPEPGAAIGTGARWPGGGRQVGDRSEPGQRLQVGGWWGSPGGSRRLVAGEGLRRRRPDRLDGLGGVVGRDLGGRGLGHEEPGVEPPGATGRGDPVET